MVKYILKFYRWIFSLCEHDWKIVKVTHINGGLYSCGVVNPRTKIYEVCQKCKEPRIRYIQGSWDKEDLI